MNFDSSWKRFKIRFLIIFGLERKRNGRIKRLILIFNKNKIELDEMFSEFVPSEIEEI